MAQRGDHVFNAAVQLLSCRMTEQMIKWEELKNLVTLMDVLTIIWENWHIVMPEVVMKIGSKDGEVTSCCEFFSSGQMATKDTDNWFFASSLLYTLTILLFHCLHSPGIKILRNLPRKLKWQITSSFTLRTSSFYLNTRLLNLPSFHKHKNQCPEMRQSHS